MTNCRDPRNSHKNECYWRPGGDRRYQRQLERDYHGQQERWLDRRDGYRGRGHYPYRHDDRGRDQFRLDIGPNGRFRLEWRSGSLDGLEGIKGNDVTLAYHDVDAPTGDLPTQLTAEMAERLKHQGITTA